MMDWSAKLFGLSDAFLNTSGVGGGVMLVWDGSPLDLILSHYLLYRPRLLTPRSRPWLRHALATFASTQTCRWIAS